MDFKTPQRIVVIIMMAFFFLMSGYALGAADAITNTPTVKSAQADQLEYLHKGEAYEANGQYEKAVESYERMVQDFNTKLNNTSDDVMIITFEELITTLNYRIDSINITKLKRKDYKPRVNKLKLGTAKISLVSAPITGMTLSNEQKHIGSENKGALIVNATSSFSSSVITFGDTLIKASSNIDPPPSSLGDFLKHSEVYFEQYIKKYPDSYFTLVIKIIYCDYHNRLGNKEKANGLKREIESIAKERGMVIATDSDPRFKTPEDTWATFVNALEAGDVETIIACHTPGQSKKGELYIALGKEKMKEIAADLKKSTLLKSSEAQRMNSAEYSLIKNDGGTIYSYEIQFVNLDGEWKLAKF